MAVYLSDFGAERQRKEGVHGPSGIWERPEDEGEEDDGDGDGDEAEARLGDVDGGKVDNEKLRKYELERYKHY